MRRLEMDIGSVVGKVNRQFLDKSDILIRTCLHIFDKYKQKRREIK